MSDPSSFGIVTGCHAGDRFMVSATLASISHYMPDAGICLVQDGDFDLSEIIATYKPIVLKTSEITDARMRNLVSGNQRAKLAAMWAGPFERFVWLDADAVVWGDFRQQLDPDLDFQIFWNEISIEPGASEVPQWLPHYYFDPPRLAEFDSKFNWRGLPYFCSGAFASKRNAIPFERWMEVEAWQPPFPRPPVRPPAHSTAFTPKANPLFPALRSGHRLIQRPSRQKQIPSSQHHGLSG